MAVNDSKIEQTVTRRKGFWSRLRCSSKRETIMNTHHHKRNNDNETKYKRSSQVDMASNERKLFPQHRQMTMEYAPTARDAAFSGPPRYDWIDIETAAAIKIQAIYRRHYVLNQLEKQGYSTVAIRNRVYQRNTLSSSAMLLPNMLTCCGVGLMFGNNDDNDQMKKIQQEHYMLQKKVKAEHEAQVRAKYFQKQKAYETENPMKEAFEVVI